MTCFLGVYHMGLSLIKEPPVAGPLWMETLALSQSLVFRQEGSIYLSWILILSGQTSF